jgi:hypothetical protein
VLPYRNIANGERISTEKGWNGETDAAEKTGSGVRRDRVVAACLDPLLMEEEQIGRIERAKEHERGRVQRKKLASGQTITLRYRQKKIQHKNLILVEPL